MNKAIYIGGMGVAVVVAVGGVLVYMHHNKGRTGPVHSQLHGSGTGMTASIASTNSTRDPSDQVDLSQYPDLSTLVSILSSAKGSRWTSQDKTVSLYISGLQGSSSSLQFDYENYNLPQSYGGTFAKWRVGEDRNSVFLLNAFGFRQAQITYNTDNSARIILYDGGNIITNQILYRS